MEKQIDINGIMKLLPHRYPFLLVDRITDCTEEEITGYKNVTINEPFFQGHFPGHPIMPGVLQVEGMAQCAGCLIFQQVEDPSSKVVYFMGFDKVKFRQPVLPGDKLEYKVRIVQMTGGKVARIEGTCSVDGKVTCQAEMKAMMVDR